MSEQTLIPKPDSETLKQQQQEPITLSHKTLKTLKPLSRPVNSLKGQLKKIKSNARRRYLQTLKKKKPRQRKVPTEPRIRKGRKEMLYLFHNIKPICFSPKVIPKKFEPLLKKLDLFEFTRVEFDSVFRKSMLVDFISNYSRKEKNSFIPLRINVSKEHLARALRLPYNKWESNSIEVYTEEEISFIEEFVFDWLLVGRYGEERVTPREIVEWTRCIREGHPEKLDAAQLIWYQVEKELAQSENLVECYYASHLVCLIRSQRPDFFEEEKDEKDESEEVAEEQGNWGHRLDGNNKRLRTNDMSRNENDFYYHMELMYRLLQNSQYTQQMAVKQFQERENKLNEIIKSKDQELETKRTEVLRLEGELVLMSDRVSWLEGLLHSNSTKFADYRERYHVQEKPLYQDAGSGGMVLSTQEIEARKRKQEEDMMKEVAAQLKETRKLQKSPAHGDKEQPTTVIIQPKKDQPKPNEWRVYHRRK